MSFPSTITASLPADVLREILKTDRLEYCGPILRAVCKDWAESIPAKISWDFITTAPISMLTELRIAKMASGDETDLRMRAIRDLIVRLVQSDKSQSVPEFVVENIAKYDEMNCDDMKNIAKIAATAAKCGQFALFKQCERYSDEYGFGGKMWRIALENDHADIIEWGKYEIRKNYSDLVMQMMMEGTGSHLKRYKLVPISFSWEDVFAEVTDRNNEDYADYREAIDVHNEAHYDYECESDDPYDFIETMPSYDDIWSRMDELKRLRNMMHRQYRRKICKCAALPKIVTRRDARKFSKYIKSARKIWLRNERIAWEQIERSEPTRIVLNRGKY